MNNSALRSRACVLVVEMDPMCQRVMERILGDSCEVISACEYDKILDLLTTREFNALVVDNDFPAPGVISLFERARAVSPKTKRILMTGENVEHLSHYLRSGVVNAYVTRTTSRKDIEREVTTPAVAWKG